MIDPSLAGRSYASSTPYAIGREKIREFASAVGDDNPAFSDEAAAKALGQPDLVAPPTFASVLAMGCWRDVFADLGIDVSTVLHVDQRFTYGRQLRAGDIVRTETVLEAVRERMGASWLTIRADLRTDSAEHLCTATSTIMVRPAARD